MKRLFEAPRVRMNPIEGKTAVERDCLAFWVILRGIDLNEISLSPENVSQIPNPGPCNSVPEGMENEHERFLNSCSGLVRHMDRNEWKTKIAQCRMAILFYRAKITDWRLRDTALDQVEDPKVLIDIMMANFMENPKRTADAGTQLLKLEPGLVSIAHATAMSRFFDAQSAVGKPGDAKWVLYSQAFGVYSRLSDAGDPRVLEMDLVAARHMEQDAEKLANKAEVVARQYPELGLGPYHQGWAWFIKGNRVRAIEAVKEALRLEPGNTRFQETIEKLRTGDEEPFRVDLYFPLDPTEFMRQ